MNILSDRERELLEFAFEQKSVVVSPQDAIIYGLGIGLGDDPIDEAALAYVYERNIAVFPTMPVVLGSPGMWFDKAGIDLRKLVHAGQSVTLNRPIPLDSPLLAKNKITAVYDKGADKGAIVEVTRQLYTPTDDLVATCVAQYFCRGDGGFGGTAKQPHNDWQKPETAPDISVELQTLPQQALIYRLSGDINPLHVDPKFAMAVGFERPILHGLCTFGIAGRAMLKSQPGTQLHALSARMVKPVYPGETLHFDIWNIGNELLFEAMVPSREAKVLTSGRARIE